MRKSNECTFVKRSNEVMLLVAINYNKAAVTRKCSENIIASR